MTGLMLTAGIFMAGCGCIIAVSFLQRRLQDRYRRACGELLAAQVEAYLRGEWAEEDPWDAI